MIRCRDGFDSIVALRWSQSEFCNTIGGGADVIRPKSDIADGVISARVETHQDQGEGQVWAHGRDGTTVGVFSGFDSRTLRVRYPNLASFFPITAIIHIL